MLYIVVGVFVGCFVTFIMYKFLTPGFFFQLNSELRYEQLASQIEESFDLQFINDKERILLKNELSTNAITLLKIRRKLNRIIQDRNSSSQQSRNANSLNSADQDFHQKENTDKEQSQFDEEKQSNQTTAGNDNTQIISEGSTEAAIGAGAMAAGRDIVSGIGGKEFAELLTQEVEKRTRLEHDLDSEKTRVEQLEQTTLELHQKLDSAQLNYSEKKLAQSKYEFNIQKMAVKNVDSSKSHSSELTNVRSILMGKGEIGFPSFQRGYVWNEKALENYWDELLDNKRLFFGTIMFMNQENKRLCVDGAQRLLTVFIHLSAIRDTMIRIYGWEENSRAELIHNMIDRANNFYLPTTERYKLIQTDSAEINEIFYLEHGEDIALWNAKDLQTNLSEGLISKAYIDFREKIHNEIGDYAGSGGGFLMKHLEMVLDIGLLVQTVEGTVEDALSVFSQISERGRKLNQEDLIYASIYSMTDRISQLVRAKLENTGFTNTKSQVLAQEVEHEIGEILHSSQYINEVKKNFRLGNKVVDFIFTTTSDEVYVLEFKLIRKNSGQFRPSMDGYHQIISIIQNTEFTINKEDLKDYSFVVDQDYMCLLLICKIRGTWF